MLKVRSKLLDVQTVKKNRYVRTALYNVVIASKWLAQPVLKLAVNVINQDYVHLVSNPIHVVHVLWYYVKFALQVLVKKVCALNVQYIAKRVTHVVIVSK